MAQNLKDISNNAIPQMRLRLTIHKSIAEGGPFGKKEQDKLNGMLFRAAQKGRTRSVEALLNAGAYVNAQGGNWTTALILAVDRGHTETCTLLIEKGALFGDFTSDQYWPALEVAKLSGYAMTVALMRSMESIQKRMGKEGFRASFMVPILRSFVRSFEECISGGG